MKSLEGENMMRNLSGNVRFVLHHWGFWLLVITGIAILIRSLPAYLNPAWGCDYGIYYGLTNSFISTKDFINPYTGWGNSYQYFPVLYTITGIVHWITGIETFSLMPKIAPVLGGLTVPILYFIAYELLKNKKVALLAAALLSVATFHVYQTSHAAPMTIGHFFMMISVYFFIKALSKRRYFLPLIVSTGLLILSHHFTTYFYLISITFILYANIFNKEKKEVNSKIALAYLLGASTTAFLYWAIIATPVFNSFMTGRMFLQPTQLVGVFYLFVVLGYFVLSNIQKRMVNRSEIHQMSPSKQHKRIVTYLLLLIVASIIAAFYGIPGMTVRLTPLAVLFSIPMLLLVSFSFVGISLLKNSRKEVLIKGWIFGILLSFVYSLSNPKFFPDRHLEYLIVPLCISAAVAIKEIYDEVHTANIKSFVQPFFQPSLNIHKKRVLIISIIGLMCVANMMATYPSVEVLNVMDERVTEPCVNALEWMKGNLTTAVVASDHRLSNLLWAEGYNITFSKTNTTWTAANYTACEEELRSLNISYIVIDDIMRENVVFIGNGISYHMTNESYDKFSEEPFELIYRNASYTDTGEEKHWVEVYRYNTSTIEYTDFN